MVHGQATKTKKRVDFISFMDAVLSELHGSETTEYHVILDNYCIHKRCDEWLSKHPNVFFHYTPTSASWLNQNETMVLSGAFKETGKVEPEEVCSYLGTAVNTDTTVVHPAKKSFVCTGGGISSSMDTYYNKAPQISTGAAIISMPGLPWDAFSNCPRRYVRCWGTQLPAII